MAGVYCDGEIGPAACNGVQSGVRWGGTHSKLASQFDVAERSELQGFTTIVFVLSG